MHQPVLYDAVLSNWLTEPQGWYIDGTFGRGGHSRGALQRLKDTAHLLCVDRDPEAIAVAQTLQKTDPRCIPWQGNFSDLEKYLKSQDLYGKIQGILLDLGVSSPQLDQAYRGFSFQKEGPLDMRMDPTQGISAAAWLDQVDERTLKKVLKTYGEEPRAGPVARAIIRERPFQTTTALAQCIARVTRGTPGRHPATRTFQAIRMVINQELESLEIALPSLLYALSPKGRLAVISFHSLEDRCVKQTFQALMTDPTPRDWPTASTFSPPCRWVEKRIFPTEQECADNPRARSAVLRVCERC